MNLIEVACPRCNGTQARRIMEGRDRLHGIGGAYYVSACAGCGLWFQSPRVPPSEIPSLYPSEYTPHLAPPLPSELRPVESWVLHHDLGYRHVDPPSDKPAAAERKQERKRADLRLEPHFVADGRVVEVGSASGWRLVRLRELGWASVEGIEIVTAAAELSRSHGLVVHNLPVEEGLQRYEDRSIDALITSMVIEHLVNPFAVVKEMASKIKTGGELLFSTVVRDSLDAWIWGTYWRNLDLPRHMVWFRTSDLVKMLEPAFEDIRIVHQAEPIDFFGSAKYRQAEKRNRIDSVVTRFIGEEHLQKPVNWLAAFGLTSRVSVRARKR